MSLPGDVFNPISPVAPATNPPAATSVALTSGTAWQNTTGYDVTLYVPVTYVAGGTCAIAIGPTNATATALGTPTHVSADHTIEQVYVPAGWWAKFTLTSATFTANATAQPA